MLSYPEGTFLPIAIATHGLVGLTLGLFLFDRPRAGLVGGLFADVDFLFPEGLGRAFVHRSFTHGFLVLAVVTAVAAAYDRRAGGAVGVAYLSHLAIDTTTPQGVHFFWPVVAGTVHLDPGIGGHAPVVTVVLWLGCLGVLAVHASERLSLPASDWG